MLEELKVSLIGLDTSHAVEFARRMQSPDCPSEHKVEGLRAVNCLRFPTPFQNEEGLDERQEQMEAWGVRVVRDFSEAVNDCDAIMIEINDPSLHLEYFIKCASLGKPVFIDKPLSDNLKNGMAIYNLAEKNNIRCFSCSSIRFVPELIAACNEMPDPRYMNAYGALGIAPVGSSIIWYGVHVFEMLQTVMGSGAERVLTTDNGVGVTITVDYQNNRHSVVELNRDSWIYGGRLSDEKNSTSFVIDDSDGISYTYLLKEMSRFIRGGEPPVPMEEALHIIGMLDAAERSLQSGVKETVDIQ